MIQRGIYCGEEEQFRGRIANICINGEYLRAQFDKGKLWETHSRLAFHTNDWKVIEDDIEEDDTPLSYPAKRELSSKGLLCFFGLYAIFVVVLTFVIGLMYQSSVAGWLFGQ
jgi:hypothetical protein